jgi:topoisomerase-4 subunit A
MRISKFDSNKAQDKIEALNRTSHDLEHLIDFAVAYC